MFNEPSILNINAKRLNVVIANFEVVSGVTSIFPADFWALFPKVCRKSNKFVDGGEFCLRRSRLKPKMHVVTARTTYTRLTRPVTIGQGTDTPARAGSLPA